MPDAMTAEKITSSDDQFQRARNLFVAVVTHAINDYCRRYYDAPGNGPRKIVLKQARNYFQTEDWEIVASAAGLRPCQKLTDKLMEIIQTRQYFRNIKDDATEMEQ